MKKISVLLMVSLVILSSRCDKGECHKSITFINESSDTIIFGERYHYSWNCNLAGVFLTPGMSYNHSRSCWEDYFINNDSTEFFVIDPIKYNETNEFYDCDSIYERNLILREYNLTLMDLQSTNFIVTYP
jgi:hypothetical protein